MWEVTKTSVISEDGVSHDTFGFGISKGETVINDISLNKEKVSALVKLMNTLDVSESHAFDIAEDFLGT